MAVVDESLRADSILAAVAIDDAIVSQKTPETIEQAQTLLEAGDDHVEEAAVWSQMDKKVSLLEEAILAFQNAWETALD